MRHVIVDQWSRGSSLVHRVDARAKLLSTLLLALAITLSKLEGYPLLGVVLLATVVAAQLPVLAVLLRAAIVLPLGAVFAILIWLSGDGVRAVTVLTKSYLSALAVLTLVSTTTLPELLGALAWLRVPRPLILVAQFLYRYLFVLSEQAQRMRQASQARGGGYGSGRSLRQAATGALTTLFARSYARAEGIHRAMAARGFQGHFHGKRDRGLRAGDFAYLITNAVVIAAAWIR